MHQPCAWSGQGQSHPGQDAGVFPFILVGPLQRAWTPSLGLLREAGRQRGTLLFPVHPAATAATPNYGLWTEGPSPRALQLGRAGEFGIPHPGMKVSPTRVPSELHAALGVCHAPLKPPVFSQTILQPLSAENGSDSSTISSYHCPGFLTISSHVLGYILL